ncbi:unnamed protein product (macronuclear) [Paramecium tetraurelia]|uniref:Chromosome undetermined scaffold_108, whole genome shotgun sequence n=1 Tax=Paramecium tetraurelia TaxID=5888 RepID=Q3SDH5_PARTE|nr:uncharacterized protein GSPATT00029131001 [Paramecium tetraurelia]CAI39383.1 rac_C104 [Paramecium tetraurelia]CAK58095.1 unnamed protein product [Paramecium tetraurelia]|eukprot:XP_001425493.1 hypothetical protein (macronuclear) [Paramecium tetraurelia strain d4-2]
MNQIQSYKVILVGDNKVGKTSFFIRITKNVAPRQPQSTIGVEYATKQVVFKELIINLKIWDTAGSEKYKSLTSNHFHQSQGALLFYDLTDLYSYENLQFWLKDIYNNADDRIVIIIVGNKLDLIHDGVELRCIAQEKVQQFCKAKNLLYCEISTKTGEGINELIDQLAQNLQARKVSQDVLQQRPRQNCCT